MVQAFAVGPVAPRTSPPAGRSTQTIATERLVPGAAPSVEERAFIPQWGVEWGVRFGVRKLVRDRMPDLMRAEGLRVLERTLEEAAFLDALKEKLLEEAGEVRAASGGEELLEELADVAEVLAALVAASGFTAEELEARRLAKRAARGGFEGRIFSVAVEAEEGSPASAYYLARPDRYPPEE